MNKIILIILLSTLILYVSAQNTYVPDDNFEQALIDLGYDDVLDDYVLTDNINGISNLNIQLENISDLTGIDGFASLEELYCGDNYISILNLSQNTYLRVLYCNDNQITNLEVSQNNNLEVIVCYGNELSDINVTQNQTLLFLSCHDNQITDIDLSQNSSLIGLYCENNQLTNLYLTPNVSLTDIVCSNNQLTEVDVRNGNNASLIYFNSQNNPDLKCIFVDDKEASFLSDWIIDESSMFVETEAECNALDIENFITENLNVIYPNPSNEIIYIDFALEGYIQRLIISDINGKIILEKRNVQHNSGIDLSDFKTGIYIINIQTEKEIYTSKIVIR
jgi:Leucine-rich repeat (LRR) protein